MLANYQLIYQILDRVRYTQSTPCDSVTSASWHRIRTVQIAKIENGQNCNLIIIVKHLLLV